MGKNLAKSTTTFLFCEGSSCQKAGSEAVSRAARAYLRNNDLWETTHTIKTRCNGRCEDAPTAIVQPGNYWYKDLNSIKITEILTTHLEDNQAIESYLLFKENWPEVVSHKEIPPFTPQDFCVSLDPLLGNVFITKGFSSDQYLYPLFLKLSQKKIAAQLILPPNLSYDFKDLARVVYEDPYALSLFFESNNQVDLIIGSLPKEASTDLIAQKITSTEYYKLVDNSISGIRFKNKFGKIIGQIQFTHSENILWDYCLKIQLKGLADPVFLNNESVIK